MRCARLWSFLLRVPSVGVGILSKLTLWKHLLPWVMSKSEEGECCQTLQLFHKLLINLQGHRRGCIRYPDALAKDQGLKLCYAASEMQGGLGKIMISGCLLERWEPVLISPFLRVWSWTVFVVTCSFLVNLYWLVMMEISAGDMFMNEMDDWHTAIKIKDEKWV